MLAGTLHRDDVYIGDRVMPPTPGNPKGYYESFDIQDLNEDILKGILPSRPDNLAGNLFYRRRPGRAQRWLSVVPVGTVIPTNPAIEGRIREKTSIQPFCFKDPRFCYTLPLWRENLKNTIFFCVFRNPLVTVRSILKECKNERYLRSLSINQRGALLVWKTMYLHILHIHRREGEWHFFHYNQLFEEESLGRIEGAIRSPVNRDFPDRELNRVLLGPDDSLPDAGEAGSIYRELCMLADYHDPHWG
jgi:hypothetical protein